MTKGPASSQQLLSAPSLDIRDYMEIMRRRKAVFIQVFVMVLVVGVIATMLGKPVYQTSTRIMVPVGAPMVNMINVDNPLYAALMMAQPDPVSTQLQMMQTGEFIQDAMKKAGINGSKPGVLPPSPRVAAGEGSNVISVVVEGGDPVQISELANAMVELHKQNMDDARNQGLRKAISFVERELGKKTKDLEDAKLRMLEFRKTHRIIEEKTQQEAKAKAYSDLETEVRHAENALTSTRSQAAQLRTMLAQEPPERTTELRKDNPARDPLVQRIAKLKAQRLDKLDVFTEDSPEVKELDGRIAQTEAQLKSEPETVTERVRTPNKRYDYLQTQLEELEVDLPKLQAAYDALSARFAVQTREVQDLSPDELELARLNAQYDRLQANVNELSEHLQNMQMRKEASSASPFRLLQKAGVPGAPVRPRKSTNLLLSFVLAIVLAGGAALLQEYLDDRVNSPDDVERMTSLPALGHVPLIGPDSPRMVSALPTNSHVAEAYRALRSSVGFAGIDAPLRRLQVTSASKGEGKTVTSVNLAAAMAMDGKRVILVDADLRRPSLHRVLQVPNACGLSEVLAGMKSLDEAIQDTENENLKVICAGPIPPNPAELLGSRTFDQVIEQLEERCDILIFDTPPCIPVTDPVIVAARMDGVILVLHVGQTRKAMVRHAIELLGRARARVLGIVFNRVQSTKSGYYYYNYYYYGDGYYTEAAERGQRHRNGRKKPELGAGAAMAASGRHEDRDG